MWIWEKEVDCGLRRGQCENKVLVLQEYILHTFLPVFFSQPPLLLTPLIPFAPPPPFANPYHISLVKM